MVRTHVKQAEIRVYAKVAAQANTTNEAHPVRQCDSEVKYLFIVCVLHIVAVRRRI